MASGNIEVEVSIEGLVNKELTKAFQSLYDKYSFCVENVHVTWAEQIGGQKHIHEIDTTISTRNNI